MEQIPLILGAMTCSLSARLTARSSFLASSFSSSSSSSTPPPPSTPRSPPKPPSLSPSPSSTPSLFCSSSSRGASLWWMSVRFFMGLNDALRMVLSVAAALCDFSAQKCNGIPSGGRRFAGSILHLGCRFVRRVRYRGECGSQNAPGLPSCGILEPRGFSSWREWPGSEGPPVSRCFSNLLNAILISGG